MLRIVLLQSFLLFSYSREKICPRPSLSALHLLPKLRAAGVDALVPAKLRPFRLARAKATLQGRAAQLPGTISREHCAGEGCPWRVEGYLSRVSEQARDRRKP